MSASKDENASALLLGAANNAFAVQLHSKLAEEAGNVFFSPFSISLALSMLFRGAKEDTAAEIKKVLGFDAVELSDDDVHKSFDYLLSVIETDQDSYALSVANALASQKGFPLLSDYKEDLQKIYRALALEMDFANDAQNSIEQINNWVKENTKNMIPKVFDSLDPATVVVLLNAVYFKGTWEQQFSVRDTYPGMFYNKGVEEQVKEIPMMFMIKKFPFAQKEKYKALELPYKGKDIAMLILLPHEMNGLPALEKSLNKDFLKDLRGELQEAKVEVTMPKLHLEFSTELNPMLKKLGMNKVFECGANLKALCDSDQLKVSTVIHKAVLDVNEEGSEAAAVTAVTIMLCSLSFNPQFRADHPFFFVIYDKRNNLILFAGRVEEL